MRDLSKHGTNEYGAINGVTLRWEPLGLLYHPTLDIHTEVWLENELAAGKDIGELLPDALPKRVGVKHHILLKNSREGSLDLLIQCIPVSWANIRVMVNQKTREKIPNEQRFFALSVVCLVETGDGFFILGKRSRKVSGANNMWSVSAAGYVDLESCASWGVENSVYRELEEEVGVSPELVDPTEAPISPMLLGYCVHHSIPGAHHLELCYLIRPPFAAEEVLRFAEGAKDSWENKYRKFSRSEAAELMDREAMHPPAAVTLALALNLYR